MNDTKTFLIVDGYPKEERDKLEKAGATLAWKLYQNLLLRHLPGAKSDILLPSDLDAKIPSNEKLLTYAGVLWTGCSLTVYHEDDPRVQRQLDLIRRTFESGIPGFGSCWALQIAVVAAGGKVRKHPQGREMGFARKIRLTADGKAHPMYQGRSEVFTGFSSHDDEVEALPPQATLLAKNDHSIQSAEIKYKKGTFWGLQYHPEYDLYEMAKLMIARTEKLIRLKFFENKEQVELLSEEYVRLSKNIELKPISWKYGIDKDILQAPVREQEFARWIECQILSP